ncbi:MAG: hypothetical protein ACO3ZK_08670 [Rubrivivax sp.]
MNEDEERRGSDLGCELDLVRPPFTRGLGEIFSCADLHKMLGFALITHSCQLARTVK